MDECSRTNEVLEALQASSWRQLIAHSLLAFSKVDAQEMHVELANKLPNIC